MRKFDCNFAGTEFFKMTKFFVIAAFALVGQSLCLDYSELVRLNANCSGHTCAHERYESMDNLRDMNCECGPFCVEYSTCCIDSPYRQMNARRPFPHNRNRRYECMTVLNSGNTGVNVFSVSRCDSRWRGLRTVRSMCEQVPRSLQDPLVWTPVTNTVKNVTYKNIFCALCNNDVADLKMWTIKVEVPGFEQPQYGETSDYDDKKMEENLVYSRETNQWGLVALENNRRVFKKAELTILEPYGYTNIVRHCIPGHVVSTCADGWRDQVVRDNCRSYMALLRHPEYSNVLYRNVHCAICNFEYRDEYTDLCISKGFGFAGGGPSLSLTILLDVNLSDGNRVGEVNRCAGGKTYDPFAKKCRTLVCGLPGFEKRDGKCVRA